MKVRNQLFGGVERTVDSALAEIFKALREPLFELLIHEGLRRHDHLASLDLNLAVVARGEAERIVDLLRDDHLPAHADLDSRHHATSFSSFHIFVF